MKNTEIFYINKDFFNKNEKLSLKLIDTLMPGAISDLNFQLNGGVIFVVITHNNEPATIGRFCPVDNRKYMYIVRQIDTLPNHQGKGLGTLCLENGCKFLLKNYACKRVISSVDNENIASQRMHEKAGFTKLEKSFYTKTRYSWNGAYIYRKDIKNEMQK